MSTQILKNRFVQSILHGQFTLIFFGGLCYYAALPPLGLFPCAFFAAVCWACVLNRPERVKKRYVYFTGIIFWLAAIWWIACPHPLTALGLAALAAFLSLYWILFFAAVHNAVHQCRIPLVLAMPAAWIGCEYLRCHLLSGFSFCAIEHSFYRVPVFIQLANIGGQYLVGGFVIAVGASLFRRNTNGVRFFRPLVPLAVMLLYGFYSLYALKMLEFNHRDKPPFHRIVALQGNIPVSLKPEAGHAEKTLKQFRELTYRAVDDAEKKGSRLPELIIFPETVCPIPVLEFTGSIKPADLNMTDTDVLDNFKQLQGFVNQIQTPVLFGLSTFSFADTADPQRFNSALLVRPASDLTQQSFRYDKIHLVMFGEYVPFSQYLPDGFIIKTLCQEAGRGTKPAAMPLGNGITASVNICFESSVPHLIRRHILLLRKQGSAVNLLINISNDGWFRFSQQIDQHLATHVFRAVENGLWYVSAANGGYSAVISPGGVIESLGTRGEAEAVAGTIYPEINYPLTLYQYIGGGYALFFAVLTIAAALLRCRRILHPVNRVQNG